MAEIIPKIVNNSVDLRCAQKIGETVIICTDRQFFVELDKKVSGNNVVRKTRSLGKKGIIAGAILSFFTAGLGLVVVGLSALGTIAGVAMDQFKDYKVIMDYADQRVIFLKEKGNHRYDENRDTIKGIDLNQVIQKNNRG